VAGNSGAGKARFTGVSEVSGKLREIRMTFPTRMADALMMETEVEATEARRRTPVKTGLLRSTVRAEGPYIKNGVISTAVSAGSAAADYALPVHEDLEAHHRVGEAKFIESTLKESAPHMGRRVARRLKL
jgi:hypothetical protein